MVLLKPDGVFIFDFSNNFTFHYGPSQTQVFFQSLLAYSFYIPLWSFSNERIFLAPSSASCFTFHYGPSQTCYLGHPSVFNFFFYIPLWSFSNKEQYPYPFEFHVFTFHYVPSQTVFRV